MEKGYLRKYKTHGLKTPKLFKEILKNIKIEFKEMSWNLWTNRKRYFHRRRQFDFDLFWFTKITKIVGSLSRDIWRPISYSSHIVAAWLYLALLFQKTFEKKRKKNYLSERKRSRNISCAHKEREIRKSRARSSWLRMSLFDIYIFFLQKKSAKSFYV